MKDIVIKQKINSCLVLISAHDDYLIIDQSDILDYLTLDYSTIDKLIKALQKIKESKCKMSESKS